MHNKTGKEEVELRDERLLVVVAVCQRSPKIELGIKTSESRVTGGRK